MSQKIKMVQQKKDWTIMVYMAGDNNLSREMAYALQEIRDVAKKTKGNLNLLAFFDSSLKEVPTSYYDFTNYSNDYEYFRVDETKPRFVAKNNKETSANKNSATAYSILNFIDWCVNEVKYQEGGKQKKGRKAKNYALIFSGHSFGFLDFGLFTDENSNNHLTLAKLSWALEDKIVEVLDGKKLSILGFDSCVMSMLEVGYALRNTADTLIASEGTIPNTGWTYRKLIEKISESKNLSSKEVSRLIVEEFVATQKNVTNGGVSIDMAAWDLSKVKPIVKKFEAFSNDLINCLLDNKSTLYKQMQRVLIQVRMKCQPYMYDQNVDLIDFCSLLLEELASLDVEFKGSLKKDTEALKLSCSQLIKSVQNCILISGFCGGANQYSNGISLFFPWTFNSYLISLKNYSELVFCDKTQAGINWNAFLFIYLTQVSYRQARDEENFIGKNKINSKGNETFFYNQNAGKIPPNLIDRIPPNLIDRIPPNLIDRIPPNLIDRIPPNLIDRIPPNLIDRIPPNLIDRIPPNLIDRIPPNLIDRIPPNLIDRGGFIPGLNKFMEQFSGFRNVAAPWNISGFNVRVSSKKKKKVK